MFCLHLLGSSFQFLLLYLTSKFRFLYSYSSCQNERVSMPFAPLSDSVPTRRGYFKNDSISPSLLKISLSLLALSFVECHISILMGAVSGIFVVVNVLSTSYDSLLFTVSVLSTSSPLTKSTTYESQPEDAWNLHDFPLSFP